MTLEEAIDWISDRELIEVTPKSIRIRCRILDPHLRMREQKAQQSRDENRE